MAHTHLPILEISGYTRHVGISQVTTTHLLPPIEQIPHSSEAESCYDRLLSAWPSFEGCGPNGNSGNLLI